MGPLGGSVGDTLAQALALLEQGKDREAEALLLAPQEGPLEAERLALFQGLFLFAAGLLARVYMYRMVRRWGILGRF